MLVLSALCLASATQYRTYTADMDFLHRQKKIFELFFYVDQNTLMDAEFYEVGRNFDLRNNNELFMKKEAYSHFFNMYRAGFLNRDAIFSPYYREHREECRALYNMFYYAKDFTSFYKTACWARLHMNEGTFICALSAAIMYRNDTKFMRMPELYETYPYMYFDAKVIQEAQRIKMARGNSYRNYEMGMKRTSSLEATDSYLIYANYTGSCCRKGCNYGCGEYELDYFMEDIGLNNFYAKFRMAFPFWMNTKEYDFPKDFRGKFYMYIHRQLMARYNLERYTYNMGDIEYTDYYRNMAPGFYSSLNYHNGVAMPFREKFSSIPYYKNKNIKEIEAIEFRILNAIDSGYVRDEQGKEYSIMNNDGLNILGNLIEGNGDSYNMNYYGSYEALGRDLFGYNFDRQCKNYFVPSSLQMYSTSMRDPMWYRLFSKIMNFYYRYEQRLPTYRKDDLAYNGIKIESVNMDKLMTYFEYYDALINNAVTVENMKDGRSFNIKARQYRLNYRPFTYRFNVNSDKEAKMYVRIFLGPADNFANEYEYFRKNYFNYFQLDRFVVNLKPGMNNIDRRSSESPFMREDRTPADNFYKRIQRAIEGSEPFTYTDRQLGFPARLMLPAGRPEGQRYRMFFFMYPYGENKAFDIPAFGRFYDDGRPFGFPLDRPMAPWFMDLPNAYWKDITIYNMRDEREMREYRERESYQN